MRYSDVLESEHLFSGSRPSSGSCFVSSRPPKSPQDGGPVLYGRRDIKLPGFDLYSFGRRPSEDEFTGGNSDGFREDDVTSGLEKRLGPFITLPPSSDP